MEPSAAEEDKEEGNEAEERAREVEVPLVVAAAAAAMPLVVSASRWRPMGRNSESRSVPLFGCGVIASESQIIL